MENAFIEVTASVLNHQIDNVTRRLSGEVGSFWAKHVSSFKNYVRSAHKRYERTKTLLYKDKDVLLSDIYVGTRLQHGHNVFDEEEFLGYLLSGKRCLVSATAGSGKSFFSKWMFLKILSGGDTIPLFVELRNLNNTENGIIDHLVQDLRNNFKVSVTSEIMIELIAKGKFALLLDGYDELTSDKVKSINHELKALEVPFSESAILISSRPGGEDIDYLSGFSVYKVLPLELSQALSLVEKLNYDKTVKKSFLKALSEQLFIEHEDFLSNPLLLTIMLMTYGDLAEIPSKMHIFYEQAFDTLFYRHDSSKGMYRREIKCGLAIDDFRDILSCVSASSYIRGQISLTNTNLIEFVRKAKQTANITKLNPSLYVEDLVQSVCIFLPDGTRYTYNHRSFQEYFAALFLVQIPTVRKLEVYRRFLDREETDSALRLAFEMNQVMVEREFIRPMLKKILEKYSSPELLLKAQMSSIRLIRRRINGPVGAAKMGKPGYQLVDATEIWKFQVFLERVYKKCLRDISNLV